MDELIQNGREARSDWRAYHTTSEEVHPSYHNRPDCPDGSQIEDQYIREGTDGRPLCHECRKAQGVTS